MKIALSFLALFVLLISSIAVAHTDGIYNPTGNSVGDTQGIDSNGAVSSVTTGSALLIDNINPALLIDNINPACLAGGC